MPRVIHQIKQDSFKGGKSCDATRFFKIEARPLGERVRFFAQVAAGGLVRVPIIALVDGNYTNAEPRTEISIARPIDGINSGGEMVGNTFGGADQEPQGQLRSRMLAR